MASRPSHETVGISQKLSSMWARLTGRDNAAPAGGGVSATELSEQERARIASLPDAVVPADQTIEDLPLVVFDLETTGLDMARDVVLSAGAVRIERQSIVLGKPFECVLNVDTTLRPDGQLIHGLTKADLQQGQPPAQGLLDLLEYGQDAIWLAYHAAFDHAMLKRAVGHWLGLDARKVPEPLDLAHLAPMLFPSLANGAAGLDYWLEAFRIDMPARHHAAADAFATAQIGLIVLAQARKQGMNTWGDLHQALKSWQAGQNQRSKTENFGF